MTAYVILCISNEIPLERVEVGHGVILRLSLSRTVSVVVEIFISPLVFLLSFTPDSVTFYRYNKIRLSLRTVHCPELDTLF